MRHARPRVRGLTPPVIAFCLLVGTAGCGSAPEADPPPSSTPAAQQSAPVQLPKATTFTTIKDAPNDTESEQVTDGTVVHPKKAHRLYRHPGGEAFALLPAKELGSPSWVPVIDRERDWVRVLLPSRPNAGAGWIRTTGLRTAHTPWRVDVDVDARELTLFNDDEPVGHWQVAVGKAKDPTPRVRTFIMASVIDSEQAKYTPIVLPLGAHSDTLDTFGGGPGTVAIHGWPDASVFGHAASHGCIRVPSVALSKLRTVPLGSLVVIH